MSVAIFLRSRQACRAAAVLLFALAAMASYASAQDMPDPALVLPADAARVSGDAVTVRLGGRELGYVPGLGWTDGGRYGAPAVREDGRVVIGPDFAEAMGLAHVRDARTGQDGATTRLVLDLAGLGPGALEGVRREARLRAGDATEIALPGVLVPERDLFAGEELTVRVLPAEGATPARLRIQGPALTYRVFPLADPTRLVVDLTPATPGAVDQAADPGEAAAGVLPREPRPGPAPLPAPSEERPVAPGVAYRLLEVPAAHGSTRVHVLTLETGAVELRVVGRSGEGRTVPEWAGGALAAINAGYFDPGDFEAIGLRRIGGELLSLPSRSRTAVGFGPEGTVIARADATVEVRIRGGATVRTTLSEEEAFDLSRVPGTEVGTRRSGVLAVGAGGVVRSNTIGPVRVPEGGYALAYEPGRRALARLEPGAHVYVSVALEPPALERSRWVVEAGPMLVREGRPAFSPDEEAFTRGTRILDEPTQQAALGVRPDGTVLFVVAEHMVAEDLVPLFLTLGAADALRLDSGSSATMVVEGHALNRLFTRRVESAIVAVPAEEADAAR